MRSEEAFVKDQRDERLAKEMQRCAEVKRVTDNMNKLNEGREKQLLDFVEDHFSKQVERQFNR